MAANNTWEPDLGYWAGVGRSPRRQPSHSLRGASRRRVGGGQRPSPRRGRPAALGDWGARALRCSSRCSASSWPRTPLAGFPDGRREARAGSPSGSSACSLRCSSTARTSGSTRPAIALALLGTALVFEGGARRCVVGGLLAGLAVALRNDALVTFFTLGVAALVGRRSGSGVGERWRELAAGAAAFVGLLAGNWLIEKAVLATGTGAVPGGRSSRRRRHRPGPAAPGRGDHLRGRVRERVLARAGDRRRDRHRHPV